MRAIATDVVSWSVCTVCVRVTTVSPTETDEPTAMPFGADSCGTKEPYIRWGPDPQREGVHVF